MDRIPSKNVFTFFLFSHSSFNSRYPTLSFMRPSCHIKDLYSASFISPHFCMTRSELRFSDKQPVINRYTLFYSFDISLCQSFKSFHIGSRSIRRSVTICIIFVLPSIHILTAQLSAVCCLSCRFLLISRYKY